jgi:hypothetical protein
MDSGLEAWFFDWKMQDIVTGAVIFNKSGGVT